MINYKEEKILEAEKRIAELKRWIERWKNQ